MAWKDVFGTIKDVGQTLVDTGSKAYDSLDRNAWVLLPAAGVLTAIGAIKALTPEAVAENADKYVINEALKSSLAESIRRQEMLEKQEEAEKKYNEYRRHDRFV